MNARQDVGGDPDSAIRVLVIDDEAKIRHVVCSALRGEATTCLQAATGAEGLAFIEACLASSRAGGWAEVRQV